MVPVTPCYTPVTPMLHPGHHYHPGPIQGSDMPSTTWSSYNEVLTPVHQRMYQEIGEAVNEGASL